MNRSVQKSLETDIKIVSNNLLNLFAQKLTRKEYLDTAVEVVAEWTDFRCVGIRILDAQGYISYEAHKGFSSQFLEKENRLSIKTDVCACIRVIKGEFNFSDQSAKTPHGSFYCEDSTRFIAGLTQDQKALFRGTCIETGFKSICLVPVRYRNEILGAIHLADEKEAVISRNSVEFIESMALLIGEAIFRYRLESALEDSENQYRTLVENSTSGIYLVQDGKIIFVNKKFADNYGYVRDEMIGMDSLEIVHPEDRRLVEDIRQKRLKRDQSLSEYEIRGVRKNGETIWLQRRNMLIEYQGKPSILGYEIDITERKLNEYILQENRELLETFFDNIHFLVAYMDRDFNFIRVNRAYAEADGRPPEFYTGKNHFALFPNMENEKIFLKVVETGEPYFVHGKSFEYDLNPEKGTTYWDWSLQPVKDAAGRVNGVVLSLVDITERKRAEESLRQANAFLEKQTAELSQRAAQLSRLTSELTLAEQRERQRIAEILHDHLQQLMVGARMGQEALIHGIDSAMKPAAEHVLDLISQSIQSSRSLTVDISPPILRYADLSSSLEWLARWMHENQGFEVKLQNEAGIVLDRKDLIVLLFQSIRELLLNVLKHSGVKSAVVKMEQKKGELWIIISDRGKGFDPEIVLKNAGTSQNFGLICIRERLMHLGGRLELESTPNAGSSISLIVPLGEKMPVEKALPEVSEKIYSKPVSDPPGIGEKIRVLLADDHPIVRQGLVTMLNLQPDIEVVGEASDGEEAVNLAMRLQPDVVLMDINMPRMNGLEATRIIHSEFPDIRIIGLSMYTEDEQAAAMIDAGASAYRSKSENIALLLAAIRGGVE